MKKLLSKEKVKTHTYHVQHSYVDVETNLKFDFQSQIYQIGVYGIVNGESHMQVSLEPSDMVKIDKKLKKMEESGKIKDLQFGRLITVSDATGFWEEVKS